MLAFYIRQLGFSSYMSLVVLATVVSVLCRHHYWRFKDGEETKKRFDLCSAVPDRCSSSIGLLSRLVQSAFALLFSPTDHFIRADVMR